MLKIPTFVLKNLLVLSVILTAFQSKMVKAQMVYMPAPTPVNQTTNFINEHFGWALFIGVCALVGLIVLIKLLISFIIKAFSRK